MIKIYLDAGHGGGDPGVVFGKLIEKELNLIVTKEVERCLRKKQFIEGLHEYVIDSIDVQSTHSYQSFEKSGMSIMDRCAHANDFDADIFVSIHHNAGGGQGYEVIHTIHGGDGVVLAECIGNEFSAIGQKKRRIFARESSVNKKRDFYGVIRHTKMPAVITEFAFVDTEEDRKMIDTKEKLLKEGQAIAQGILNFFKFFKKKNSENRNYTQVKAHFAEEPYKKLLDAGITIHEKRFNDMITRGEVFALISQLSEKRV